LSCSLILASSVLLSSVRLYLQRLRQVVEGVPKGPQNVGSQFGRELSGALQVRE
jgi:hypothetical protein